MRPQPSSTTATAKPEGITVSRARAGTESGRVQGVDVARGLASLIMIQGHAYHGWVAAEHHDSAAYQLTRVLGTLPLPAFLLLAGAAVALRVEAAERRGESATAVRRRLVRRGLTVMAVGYAASAVSALMDGGWNLPTVLRADVLQVIGLGIVVLAMVGVRGRAAPPGGADVPPASGRLAATGLASAVVCTALCPLVTPWAAEVPGAARFLVALVADVPGITRMPLVPLFAWMGAGAAITYGVRRRRDIAGDRFAGAAGAPAPVWLGLLALGIGLAVCGQAATERTVAALGGALSRAHPAVVLNVVDLLGRGLVVLAAGCLAAPFLPSRLRVALVRLGQGSLVAYVVHIPFAYGALGGPLRGRLDMATATLWVLLLAAASYAAVRVVQKLEARPSGRTPASSTYA